MQIDDTHYPARYPHSLAPSPWGMHSTGSGTSAPTPRAASELLEPYADEALPVSLRDATIALQKKLGVPADGVLGPVTLRAFNAKWLSLGQKPLTLPALHAFLAGQVDATMMKLAVGLSDAETPGLGAGTWALIVLGGLAAVGASLGLMYVQARVVKAGGGHAIALIGAHRRRRRRARRR
jgi:hypothetical protein